jgi:hypothetical protein
MQTHRSEAGEAFLMEFILMWLAFAAIVLGLAGFAVWLESRTHYTGLRPAPRVKLGRKCLTDGHTWTVANPSNPFPDVVCTNEDCDAVRHTGAG